MVQVTSRSLVVLSLVASGMLPACSSSDGDTTGSSTPAAGAGGSGGAAAGSGGGGAGGSSAGGQAAGGAGTSGSAGASGASGVGGMPRDAVTCSFETPPVHATAPEKMPGAIRAGFGSAYFPMPIGTPLGGYTERALGIGGGNPPDARPVRIGTGFRASAGVHDAPRAEAAMLEIAGDRLVIVRLDVVLATDIALFDLEKLIAPDGSMRGRVIITSSHTHAGWGAWQPTYHLLPGTDLPRPELYQRALDTMAKAVADAESSLADAKIGVAVDTAFDPMNTISQDRRKENDTVPGPDGNTAGKGKDPTMWAMRIDHTDGSPMLALVDFGIHGTIGGGSNPLASTDAPGSIVRALSSELGYPVMHLQGAAGDISPVANGGRKACPDDVRCLDFPAIEMLGAKAVPLVAPVLAGISTVDSAAMEVVTRSYYSGRNATVTRPDGRQLVYTPADKAYKPDGVIFDPDGRVKVPIDEFNTDDGAGLCGATTLGVSIAPIPGDKGVIPYSSCLDLRTGAVAIFGLFGVSDAITLPLCDTTRATSTAVRVSGLPGGDWLLVTAPGEPVAPFAQYLRNRSPAGPDRTLLLGYADDHVGYILTAEDWLQGGYEPSINLWGPMEGEVILDGMLDTAAIAFTHEVEDPEATSSRFTDYKWASAPPLVPLVTTDHGTKVPPGTPLWFADTKDPAVAVAPAAEIPRAVGLARFGFFGGDPVVDQPVVTVEHKKTDGTFEPLVGETGVPANSFDGAIVVTYVPIPLTSASPTQHAYAAAWQAVPADPFSLAKPTRPYGLPLGTYRLHVEGKAQTSSGLTTYSLSSDEFAIVAAPLSADSSATRAAGALTVKAMLGDAPGYRALKDGISDVGIALPGPWKATWKLSDGTMKSGAATPDGDGSATIPVDAADLSKVVSVELRDEAGNGGVLAVP